MPEITEQELVQYNALKNSLALRIGSITTNVIGKSPYFYASLVGMTAYGDTQKKAIERLKEMFRFSVDMRVKHKTLIEENRDYSTSGKESGMSRRLWHKLFGHPKAHYNSLGIAFTCTCGLLVHQQERKQAHE